MKNKSYRKQLAESQGDNLILTGKIRSLESEIDTLIELCNIQRSIISDLFHAVPSQNNDNDWWPNELTKAMKTAENYI